ncbi:tetratricopeptide repeat protein [Aliivibrio wodanis]|uniref:tetratricopeptide repeat protein n=1 Tax=Aliivibrio wodanis TaxID=80852 RepID=UPI00406CC55D
MHTKNILILVLLLSLAGCASKPTVNTDEVKETILINTSNYSDLIVFYKEQLKSKPDPIVREKLAQAYLDNNDPEAALFTIQANEEEPRTIQSYLIEANAQLDSGEVADSLETAKQVYWFNKNNAEIENLLGVIYGTKKDVVQARYYFNLARKHLYSDTKIKNNLAMLDIIEGKYDQANNRLLHVYMSDQSNDRIQSNLMLAMAKSGDLDLMKEVLAPKYTESEIEHRYYALRETSRQEEQEKPLENTKNDK